MKTQWRKMTYTQVLKKILTKERLLSRIHYICTLNRALCAYPKEGYTVLITKMWRQNCPTYYPYLWPTTEELWALVPKTLGSEWLGGLIFIKATLAPGFPLKFILQLPSGHFKFFESRDETVRKRVTMFTGIIYCNQQEEPAVLTQWRPERIPVIHLCTIWFSLA